MNFQRGANPLYKDDEKLELAKAVGKYKKQYDEKVKKGHGKTKYDYRRKRHVVVKPKWSFYSKAMREFYTGMKDVLNDHPDFQRGIKVATRAFENIANLRDPPITSRKESTCFWWWQKMQSSGNSFHIISLVC